MINRLAWKFFFFYGFTVLENETDRMPALHFTIRICHLMRLLVSFALLTADGIGFIPPKWPGHLYLYVCCYRASSAAIDPRPRREHTCRLVSNMCFSFFSSTTLDVIRIIIIPIGNMNKAVDLTKYVRVSELILTSLVGSSSPFTQSRTPKPYTQHLSCRLAVRPPPESDYD